MKPDHASSSPDLNGHGATTRPAGESQPLTGGQGQPSTSHTGRASQNLLAEDLGELARELQTHTDPAQMLVTIVAAAVQMIPGAEEGSISVVRDRRHVTSEAPTSDLPKVVDHLQEETRQGPCLDAVFHQQTVRVVNMAYEQRWPRFAARANAVGAASMLSLQLFVQSDNLGALNLYSHEVNAFSDESEHIGLLFASHAALAYAAARTEEQLHRAVDSRDLIGQAKGILMERYHIPADRAFMVLVRVSQNTNRKLNDIAEELTQHGTLPGA